MSDLELRELNIEGFTVRVTRHPSRAAAKLLAKVGRAVGPGLAKLVTLPNGNIKETELADIAPAVAALFSDLDDDVIDSVIDTSLKHTTITMPDAAGQLRVFDLSKPAQIDAAFAGRFLLMLRVVYYALEVNFGDFFGAKGALAALIGAAGEAPSK